MRLIAIVSPLILLGLGQALLPAPARALGVCADPEDNIFLECAEAARAHYLVTGNQKHFPAKWADTQIVTARRFLDEVEDIREYPG